MKVAIFGSGRSGISAARAALSAGDAPCVYDERPVSDASAKKLEGIEIRSEWKGPFDEDLIITSPGVRQDHPVLIEAVGAGKQVISEIEYAYRIAEAPIVAITGTNGKSTTTVMTYLCLKSAGQEPILCGNICGSGYDEVPLAEAAAKAGANAVLVAEVSSFQLEWVRQFRPVAAGITNIWPDHLDRYGGSFEAYAAVKHRIFSAQGPSDWAVVRANDPSVHAPHGHGSPAVLTFGPHGVHADVGENGFAVLGREIRDLPFSEPHNRLNAAMACLLAFGCLKHRTMIDPDGAAAELLDRAEEEALSVRSARQPGYSRRTAATGPMALPEEVARGLYDFRGLSHRMEVVGERDGVNVINNSMCTNPDAIIKSSQGISGVKRLLIGGRNKGLDFRPVRAFLSHSTDHAYLFGEDRKEIDEALGGNIPQFETMRQAFEAAVSDALPGETVMLAPGCASTDQFEDFRDRGNVFKQIAKEWLAL